MQVNKKHRKDKYGRLKRRHMRVRRKLNGTSERPRLMVRKTLKHIYINIIDDSAAGGGKTLMTVSTNRRGADRTKNYCNRENAKALGGEAGKVLKEKNIDSVVFDRGGYRYHGIVKELCEAVREAGIKV